MNFSIKHNQPNSHHSANSSQPQACQKAQLPSRRAKGRRAGFSLVELMIGVTVMVIATTQTHNFFMHTIFGLHKANLELSANMDDRAFINRIEHEASQSSYMILHDAFDGKFRNANKISTVVEDRVGNHSAGNFVFFISVGDDPDPYDSVPAPLEKIIGYYLDDEDPENQKIRRFEERLYNTYVSYNIESYLPSESEMESHPIVFERVNGLLEGNIFYKINNSGLLLCAEALSGQNEWEISRSLNSTIKVGE